MFPHAFTGVRCYERIAAEALAYLQSLGKKYGKVGGKKAAKNMTAEERSMRAKKASMAAAKKRTRERLARERPSKRAEKAAKK